MTGILSTVLSCLATLSVLSACGAHGGTRADRASSSDNQTALVAAEPIDTDSSGSGAMTSGPVQIRATLSHALYTRWTPPRIVLKIDYQNVAHGEPARRPLNLTIVLDRSESMREQLPCALDAARLAIDSLSSQDIVSLIASGESALVLAPAGRVVNKAFLHHRLEETFAIGGKNLAAGLREGIAQINSQRTAAEDRRLLLITGEVAQEPSAGGSEIQAIARDSSGQGMRISTFACGAKRDSSLLTDLARVGNGSYVKLGNVDQLPAALKRALGVPAATVGRDILLETRISGGRIAHVYGDDLAQAGPVYTLDIDALRAGERGVALLEIEPANSVADAQLVVDIGLAQDDSRGARHIERRFQVRATRTGDGSIGSMDDEDVLLYADIMRALERAEDAASGLDIDSYVQVRDSYPQLYERAHERALLNMDQELLNHAFMLSHLMEELSAAETAGLLHGHEEARQRIKVESEYRRYLRSHHRL